MKKMKYDFNNIISKFDVNGRLLDCVPYGEGHINETYLATLDDNGKTVQYILQKINTMLFKDVDKLMHNIVSVTDFARKRIVEKGGDPDRESLTVVFTRDGKPYHYDTVSKGTFRLYVFITDAVAYQIVEKPEHFYQSALAFGNFANLLAEFDASSLYEILPEFHNTQKRFNDLLAAVYHDKCGRKSSVQKEIDFFVERRAYAKKIVDLIKSGEMPLKVTHNDTKLNNVLIDAHTDKYVAVIDLDTIMPGSICYDFGDSIRFGCNTAAEDEKDLTKVNFDINLFETYARGYLKALGDSVTAVEKDNLAFGAILMTYECGMRFLADYLDGDVYFRIHREEHNLDRARTQIKLVSDMEKRLDEMKMIINKY